MERIKSVRGLARRLDLSPSTVSLALRGSNAVAEATRKRIIAAARRHGFAPNVALSRALTPAKGRVTKPSNRIAIAYVYSVEEVHDSRWPSYLIPFAGLTDAAEPRGFLTESFNLRNFRRDEQLCRVLVERGFEAVVFGPVLDTHNLRPQDWSHFTLVQLSRTQIHPRTHSIRSDVMAGTQLMVEHVLGAGFKRPGIILPLHDPPSNDDRDRRGGWLCQRDIHPELRHVPPLTRHLGRYEKTHAAWHKRYKPDCIIGFNSYDRWVLKDTGVPLDLSKAYFQMEVSEVDHGISGISTDPYQQGHLALDLVERTVRFGEPGFPAQPIDLVLQPLWVDR